MANSRQRSAAKRRRAAAASRASAAGTALAEPGEGAGVRAPAEAVARPERRPWDPVPADLLADAPPGPPTWVPWAALVLCVLGLADASYLTYTHLNPGALFCSTSGLINCQKVTTSPQSMVFGVIPVAYLGLAFFVPMVLLNLPPVWRWPDVRLAWLRLGALVVGMGMVIYLVCAELFEIDNICEYCTGVHIITFLLFVLTVLTFPAVSYRARWLAWALDERADAVGSDEADEGAGEGVGDAGGDDAGDADAVADGAGDADA